MKQREYTMTFKQACLNWFKECFPEPKYLTRAERCARFIEEALELVQSVGIEKETVLRIVDYVYGRPKGEIGQEIAGVAVTLTVLAEVLGESVEEVSWNELDRIRKIEVMELIREKQKGKPS